MDKNFKVKVNDTFEYDLKESDLEQLDLLKLNNGKYHVLNNGKSYHVKLEQANFNKKQYVINVNSSSYTINIANQLDLLIKEMGFSIGNAKKANDVKAPMPGMILSVNVEEGQEVKEGDTLLILEAMKMENAIGAPKDGVIKAVSVKGGGTVEKGELMIEMADAEA